MKTLTALFVLPLLTLSFLPAPVAADTYSIDSDSYGAITYSPKTGTYGYSWNHYTLGSAQATALANCNASDARVLTWVRFGWAALVITEDNAYGYAEVHGDGASSGDAYNSALTNLRQHSNARVTTIIIICSGNVLPQVITR